MFNTTRDIYHYRYGRIKAETIKELILFLCTSRFDLEVQEAKDLKRFFSLNETEALREEKDDKLKDIEIEQISDTEEQAKSSRDLIDIHDDKGENESDHDDTSDHLLPDSNTQPRISVRKRKYIEDDIYQSY